MSCQSFAVGGAVFRQVVADVEQIDVNIISAVEQHSCHCKRVASVVAGSGEHYDILADGPFFRDGLGESFCRTFHQID